MTILENGITEDMFQKTVLRHIDEHGNTVFGWLLKIPNEVKQEILENQRKVGQIEAYVRLLQDGDPENEDSKKILDYINEILERKM